MIQTSGQDQTIEEISKLLGIDFTDVQKASLTNYLLNIRLQSYNTGRQHTLAEAASVVEQCIDCDPTLKKLANAIRRL